MDSDKLARHLRACKKNPENQDYVDDRRKDRPGRNFFLTWHEHVKYIATQLGEMHEDIESFIICDELGAGQEGHEHSHAVIIMKEHKMTFWRFKNYWEIHELPMYSDISACRNIKQSIKYCSKEDFECNIMNIDHDYLSTLKLAWCYAQKVDRLNPLHYPYCRLIPGEQRKFREFFEEFIHKQKTVKAKAKLANCELYAWQRKALEQLKIQDDRTVFWIYDQEGNKGKTFLSQYCAANLDCIVLENGGKKDLAYTYGEQEYVVFDFTRSMEENINYSFIEALKNGRIFSSKYESRIKIFDPAKVICMANFMPDQAKLSADRWMIWGILDNDNFEILD
ncbi:Master replication protein [Mizuhopecten yessoensis]|uniref:Master replication protein n=1 Tax=Mizuhopecten yessoensis TaxID=6573 RepID=A0A210PDC7_MIZYE|nr:Master replication protein [Mizuhopecten yessoensis]